MHASTVIKWGHRLVTVVLLLLVAGFLYPDHDSDYRKDDALFSKHEIAPDRWLYTTQNNSGGATVTTVYLYYLANKLDGTDEEIATALKQNFPFLQGYGSIVSVTSSGDTMDVTYSGNVLSLNRSAVYSVGERQVTVKLTYRIQ